MHRRKCTRTSLYPTPQYPVPGSPNRFTLALHLYHRPRSHWTLAPSVVVSMTSFSISSHSIEPVYVSTYLCSYCRSHIVFVLLVVVVCGPIVYHAWNA
ncbi:hypothetical protein L226DRAFT_167630 [Lentinus tigrinus ALCF2SS1-7]|uniref:uncharacterized protein n=1 Tax=Lentinus tigrinus ALCF2SS1-7 TaxID=1328758 RepID=UPI001165D783|nr:hypothetical protein L226DRAFT_167630 [Lentinus tigrinus ALCF2SS1-7]